MKLTPERAMEYLLAAISELRTENMALRAQFISKASASPNETDELIDLIRPGEGLHRTREGWSYYFPAGNYIRPIKGETWMEVLRKLRSFRERGEKE